MCLYAYLNTDRTKKEKIRACSKVSLRIVFLFMLLYFFICSLDFLSDAFRLLGGIFIITALLNNKYYFITLD